jgi:hypothetical protein
MRFLRGKSLISRNLGVDMLLEIENRFHPVWITPCRKIRFPSISFRKIFPLDRYLKIKYLLTKFNYI